MLFIWVPRSCAGAFYMDSPELRGYFLYGFPGRCVDAFYMDSPDAGRNCLPCCGSSFQLFPVFLCINIWHHFIVIHSFCLYSGYILKLILLFYNFSFVISCFSVLLTGTYKYFFISHFLFFEFYELTLQNIFHILSQQPCCLSALSTQASQKQLDTNAWPVSSGCDCGRMLESLNILFLSQAGAARKRL